MSYLYFTIATIFWGSGYVLSTIPLNEVTPTISVFTRFAIVSICSLVILFYHWSTFLRLDLKDHLLLILIGIFLAIYNWFYLEGLLRTTVIDSIFIESAFVPILTIIIVYLLKNPITKNQWIGVSIAIVGSIFFFLPFFHLTFNSTRIWGVVLLFISVFAWISYTLLGKRVFDKINAVVPTSYAMVISSVFLLCIAYKEIPQMNWGLLSTDFWITQFYLGIFSSILGNICYSIGVKNTGPTIGSMFLFFVPVVGFVLAHLLVEETLTNVQWIGILIMLVGVWGANKVGKSS